MTKLRKQEGYDVETYLLKCQEILDSDFMEWSWEVVDDLKLYIEERGYLTEVQARAIDNYYQKYIESPNT